jgi:hypothetical protein
MLHSTGQSLSNPIVSVPSLSWWCLIFLIFSYTCTTHPLDAYFLLVVENLWELDFKEVGNDGNVSVCGVDKDVESTAFSYPTSVFHSDIPAVLPPAHVLTSHPPLLPWGLPDQVSEKTYSALNSVILNNHGLKCMKACPAVSLKIAKGGWVGDDCGWTLEGSWIEVEE